MVFPSIKKVTKKLIQSKLQVFEDSSDEEEYTNRYLGFALTTEAKAGKYLASLELLQEKADLTENRVDVAIESFYILSQELEKDYAKIDRVNYP